MSQSKAPEIPALLTADGEVSIIFEAHTNGSVQAKYRAFTDPVVAQPGEHFEIRWKSPT